MVRISEGIKELVFIFLNIAVFAFIVLTFLVPCGMIGFNNKFIGAAFLAVMMTGGFIGYGMETRLTKKILNVLLIVFSIVLFWKFILVCS